MWISHIDEHLCARLVIVAHISVGGHRTIASICLKLKKYISTVNMEIQMRNHVDNVYCVYKSKAGKLFLGLLVGLCNKKQK